MFAQARASPPPRLSAAPLEETSHGAQLIHDALVRSRAAEIRLDESQTRLKLSVSWLPSQAPQNDLFLTRDRSPFYRPVNLPDEPTIKK